MVSRQEVECAYRLILGREPESASRVEQMAANIPSWQSLRQVFFASSEFQAKAAREPIKPLNWGKSKVDVEVSSHELIRMIRHIEATWEELGRAEPYHSVLTNPKFRTVEFEKNKEEFFKSGKENLDTMRATAARYDIRIEDYKDCFELGCGVGRVTYWLAGLFPHVIAADISASHIEIAKENLAERNCKNVISVKLSALLDLQRLPEFDVFFSVIVLQHNPPPVIARILRLIFEKLRPNGIAYFQVPTYRLNYNFVAKDYLKEIEHAKVMEMHVLPQNVLFALIEECGCELLEIREDSLCAPVSNSVLVRKKEADLLASRTSE